LAPVLYFRNKALHDYAIQLGEDAEARAGVWGISGQ